MWGWLQTFSGMHGVRCGMLRSPQLGRKAAGVVWADAVEDGGSEADLFVTAGTLPITLPDYLKRFVKYANPGVEALLVLPIYLRRITMLARRKGAGSVVLMQDTVHRLAAAGLLIAGKLSHDRFFSNAHFAKVVSVSQLHRSLFKERESGGGERESWSIPSPSLLHYAVLCFLPNSATQRAQAKPENIGL